MITHTHPQDYQRRARQCSDEVWKQFMKIAHWYEEMRRYYMRGYLSREEWERLDLRGPRKGEA